MPRFNKVVAYDIETTGFSSKKNEIIEIAAVTWSPTTTVAIWSILTPPKGTIPKHITDLTGISSATMKTEPTKALKLALSEFKALVADPQTLLISHNGIAFDNPFLAAKGVKLDDKRCWDTILQMRADIAKKRGRTWKLTQDKAKTYRTKQKTNLEAAAKHYKITLPKKNHRAAADALTTLEIFKKQLIKNKWSIWQQ